MVKVAVVLSGCGHLDGAEIREAVLALLYLDQHDANVSLFAPDVTQHHVINHVLGEETKESRNVLAEAARIARGDIAPLTKLKPEAFDALILPGGYGVAKNLSDIAFKGADGTLIEPFNSIIQAFHAAQKPIGAICIAPAIVAKALSGSGATLTIGDDADFAGMIESFGCKHRTAQTTEAVVDAEHRLVSCSAYMREDRLSDVAKGIEQVIQQVIEMHNGLRMAS